MGAKKESSMTEIWKDTECLVLLPRACLVSVAVLLKKKLLDYSMGKMDSYSNKMRDENWISKLKVIPSEPVTRSMKDS